MRKLCFLVGVIGLLIGVRLHYNWQAFVPFEGELAVYHSGGGVTIYQQIPALLNTSDPVRIDIDGGWEVANAVLDSLEADRLWMEFLDNVTVVYAYSWRICGAKNVLGQRVNLMLAVGTDSVAVGSPVLMGSY